MKRLFLLLGTTMICIWNLLPAQWPARTSYTMEHGLPSNNIYELDVAPNGTLWGSTDFGIFSYDGNSFQSYGLEADLPSLDITGLTIDAKGVVWLSDVEGHAGAFFDERYHSLISPHSNGEAKSIDFYKDGWKTLFATIQSQGYDAVSLQNRNDFVTSPTGSRNFHETVQASAYMWTDRQGRMHSWGKKGYFTGDSLCKMVANSSRGPSDFRKDTLFEVRTGPNLNQGSLVVLYEGKITSISLPETDFSFKPQAIHVNDHRIFIGLPQGLLVHDREAPFTLKNPRLIFPKLNVQCLAPDSQGGLILGTQQKGMLRIPNWEVKSLLRGQNIVFHSLSKLQDGSVLIASNDNRLMALDSNLQLISDQQFPQHQRDLPMRAAVYPDGSYVIGFEHLLVHNGKHFPETGVLPAVKDIASGGQDTLFLSDGQIGTHFTTFSKLFGSTPAPQEKQDLYYSYPNQIWDRIGPTAQAMAFDPNENTLWASMGDQLVIWKARTTKSLAEGMKDLDVQDLFPLGPGRCLIATRGHGLWLFDSMLPELLEKIPGVEALSINRIRRKDSTTLWLCARTGLTEMKGALQTEGNLDFEVKTLNWGQFQQVHDVMSFQDQILIGCNNGLFILPKGVFEQSPPPPTPIVNFATSNGSSIQEETILPHGTLLQFGLRSIAFGQQQPKYQYRIGTFKPQWTAVEDNTIVLQSIPPGERFLEFRSLSPNGLPSSIARWRVYIAPPFWQQPGLIIGTILSAFASFLVIGWLIYRFWQLMNERRNRILELERKALRAQMNPHFIFNALNSIHVFIGENRPRDAHLFLSRFASLTRMTLNASANRTNTLDREIKAISTYMELEKMRLENRFDYSIDMDLLSTTESIHLPSLLIQPMLENALIHGIAPLKERRGQIMLHLREDGRYLNIEVIDNGVGRAFHQNRPRPEERHSYGTSLTQDRVRLIKGGKMFIEDLFTEEGIPNGTKCQISIPLYN